MIAKTIIDHLEEIAPQFISEDWDNVGIQIGHVESEVKKVLLALDITKEVVDDAIDLQVDMIISHHPLFFSNLKRIDFKSYKGKMIEKLIKNDILVYSAHTNLDSSNDGVNDELARVLDIKNPEILVKTKTNSEEVECDIIELENKRNQYGIGRVGHIEKTNIENLAEKIKKKLKVEDVRVYGDIEKPIKRVAVAGGSGSDFIIDAYKKKADVYITGDIKHHDAQLANEIGIILIDAGHFHTEKIVMNRIKKYLDQKVDSDVEIIIAKNDNIAPYKTI
ncbi:Nif3-like dinuclear metal center hexameric protein [Senegalia sp. (in: firmicutes)]|uniref:Nif3-like dinuclear metal center hexameric protein n=1 Tax=Senegalia sp. (in: firmicutes) TaxID=1924098 RepID=UPI003F9D7B06